MRPLQFLAVATFAAAAAPLTAQQATLGYYRFPAISGNTASAHLQGEIKAHPVPVPQPPPYPNKSLQAGGTKAGAPKQQ